MTNDEIRKSVEARERQLNTIIALLATLSERLGELVRVSEIHHQRITHLEEQG